MTLESRELVIVGGGPAGMAATLEARRAGVQVTLIEERATLGGQIYKQPPAAFAVRQPKTLGKEYVAGRALVERTLRSGAEILTGHAVWNVWQHGPFDVAVYQPGVTARTLRTDQLVLAAGASDRPVPFPGWTLPGVLTAGGAQSLVKIQRVYPGDRILMAGQRPADSGVLGPASQARRERRWRPRSGSTARPGRCGQAATRRCRRQPAPAA